MTPASSQTTQSRGRRKVAVLGATGTVGQTFVRLLEDHPWFELAEVAASERTAGRTYGECVRWVTGGQMPASAVDKKVFTCDPAVVSSDVGFSALDSTVAGAAETAFSRARKHGSI